MSDHNQAMTPERRAALLSTTALGRFTLATFYDPDQPRDDHGKFTTYSVGVPKAYFPKELHPQKLVASHIEVHKVKARTRTEAAKKVWEQHGERLLKLTLPHVKKISLEVDSPKAGVGGKLGRLLPITVHDPLKALPPAPAGVDRSPHALGALKTWAATAMGDRASKKAVQDEYDRVLPELTKHYQAAPAKEQAAIEDMDGRFHQGDRDDLVAWARKTIPGSFAGSAAASAPPPQAKVTPVEDISDVPVVYHGSRDLAAVASEGIVAKPATHIGDNDAYTWQADGQEDNDSPPIEWREHLKGWWDGLGKARQRDVQKQLGVTVKNVDDLGDRVGLVFTCTHPHTPSNYASDKAPYGAVELRTDKLSAFGYFMPDEASKDEVVFVVPANVPVSGPETVTGVMLKK